MKHSLSIIAMAMATVWLWSGIAAHAEPVPVTIMRADKKRQIGYILQTNEKGVLFSTTESGQGQPIPHADLAAVSFSTAGEIMGGALYEYSRSNWEEAEKQFKQIADNYDFLYGVSREQLGNFASEARFFQIDCLRRLGRYSEMATAMETKTGSTLEKTVAEVHLPTLELFQLWIALASENWEAVEAGLNEYETSLIGDAAKYLDSPSMQAESPATLVQLYFMRARLEESREEKDKALSDYYRVMTLDFGADRILTSKAMEAALAIQSTDEGLEGNYARESAIYALATVFMKSYNKGEISATLREFTRPPEMKASSAAPAEEPAAE